jgi:hypothetical protein
MATAQPGHDWAVTMFVDLLLVLLVAVIAGVNDNVGTICVIFMSGLLLTYALTHTSTLQTLAGKANG